MVGQQLLAIPGVSLGIATYPDQGRTTADLLAVADTSLYAQKRKAG
jgi:predicted signal transduction protein with EAL and GGDEF domain